MKKSLRNQQIRSLTNELKKVFKNRSIDSALLESLFNNKQYSKMISEMKNVMGIICKISVKCILLTPSIEEKKNPAWVILPDRFPVYGSQYQKDMKIELFFYKEITDSYYQFVTIIAHELAHIVLYSLDHSLKRSEEATDILAMILGFSKYYELGHTTFSNQSDYSQIGYFSFNELIYVLSIIENDCEKEIQNKIKVNKLSWLRKIFN